MCTKASLAPGLPALTSPLSHAVPPLTGTKMVFAGMKKPQDRADLIAYLKANN